MGSCKLNSDRCALAKEIQCVSWDVGLRADLVDKLTFGNHWENQEIDRTLEPLRRGRLSFHTILFQRHALAFLKPVAFLAALKWFMLFSIYVPNSAVTDSLVLQLARSNKDSEMLLQRLLVMSASHVSCLQSYLAYIERSHFPDHQLFELLNEAKEIWKK